MDKQGTSDENNSVPTGQQILSAVLHLWESDPATELMGNGKLLVAVKNNHPDWTLSVQRLKATLREFGLSNIEKGSPEPVNEKSLSSVHAADAEFQYSAQVTSGETTELVLESSLRMQTSKTKGNCLHSTKKFKSGDTILSEKPLLVFPPLENVPLIRKSLACAYCGKPFPIRQKQDKEAAAKEPLPGIECRATDCHARWCSSDCRDNDSARHPTCWHTKSKTGVTVDEWSAFEMFCLENQLSTEYSYGLLLLSMMKNASLQAQIKSLATIREDIRMQARRHAIMSSDTYVSDIIRTWQQAHAMLAEMCHSAEYHLEYDDFQKGLGMLNINSLHGQLYLTYSHLNHSCDPNVQVIVPEDRTKSIELKSLKDIGRGDELLVCYANMNDMDYYQRQYNLRINYGFLCTCAKCREHTPANCADWGSIRDRPRRKSVRFEA